MDAVSDFPGFTGQLNATTRKRLDTLKLSGLPAGTVLFRPGDAAQGFVLVRSGRVGVYLTGKSGREILLYSVTPGETCIQSTLGLLGGQHYSGEAIAETAVEMAMVPRNLFMDLMGEAPDFRQFVFRAFANRMADVTHVLEQVAFVKVEARLALLLLERADINGEVHLTHQAIATAIGSVREVVSRRLENFGGRGFVDLDRGVISITGRAGLTRLASQD